MRPLVAICLYLFLVLAGGALLAPWAWLLLQSLASEFGQLRPLADAPFHRYVNRCLLLLALAGLWPFLRGIGVTTLAAAGLGKSGQIPRRAGQGAALGLLSLGMLGLVTIFAGARELQRDATAAQWVAHLFNATLSAVLVGLFEEVFFRGAIFGALRRTWRWPAALVLSSALYALLHFFQRAEWNGPVDWASGLVLLPRLLRGFVDAQQLVPAFFNLTLVGVILALAYQRTGSLWFSIGLHAGWVWCLKTFAFLTKPVSGVAQAFWGTGQMVDGWLASIVLAVVLAVLWKSRAFAGPAATEPVTPSP